MVKKWSTNRKAAVMTHYTLADHNMDVAKLLPGDTIEVMVEGKIYETIIDKRKVQRFKTNTVLQYMFDHDAKGRKISHTTPSEMHTQMLDLNMLSVAFQEGKFDKRDYCEVVMQGYSVSGFLDAVSFTHGDWTIQNPAWGDTEPALICTPEPEEK